MLKHHSHRGSSHLMLILVLSALLGIMGYVVNRAALAPMRANTRNLNQMEGFYSSEMAAWHNLTLGMESRYPAAHTGTDVSTTRRNVQLTNNSLEGVCSGESCRSRLGMATFPNRQSGTSGTLAEPNIGIALEGLSNLLIRRYSTSSVQYDIPSTASGSSNFYCGIARFASQVGVRTCLVVPP